MVNLLNLNEISQALTRNSLIFSLVRIVGDPEVSTGMDSYIVDAETIPDENPCQLALSINPGVQTQTIKEEIWIALFDENLNNGFLVQKLVNSMTKLQKNVVMDDDTAIMPKAGKKLLLTDDLASAVAENLVLGQALKGYLKELASAVNSLSNHYVAHVHPYALGTTSPVLPPFVSIVLPQLSTDIKLNPLLSDFAFTKK